MSEAPDTLVSDVAVSTSGLTDQDAIELSPAFEGPERWHDYSVERGNESCAIASLPYGMASSSSYAGTSWKSHGLWRG
jgi:hypothetical protein